MFQVLPSLLGNPVGNAAHEVLGRGGGDLELSFLHLCVLGQPVSQLLLPTLYSQPPSLGPHKALFIQST